MANIYGRQVVLPLTNKSGGGVIAGDVVIIDTSNDGAFTTTTTGGYGGSVGIAQETIANNATGRVLVAGYAALVNVPSSQTRGHFIKTHTVAKQATGASSRAAGMFGQLLTGGSTPTAWLWGMTDNAGASGETVATSAIWTTAGKAAIATGSGTATEQWPPGHEFDYVQKTSDTSITATTGATANTVVTANAVTYDGSTVILIEFFTDSLVADNTAAARLIDVVLYDGSTELGIIGRQRTAAAANNASTCHAVYRLTPSAASHTYSVRAYVSAGTGTVAGGNGTAGNHMPCFIRQTKV